jgi:hypothetical protein
LSMTVNPTSSTNHASQVSNTSAAKPASRQTQSASSSGSLPQDAVTLSRGAQASTSPQKSSGDVNHDGDSR